jgi:dihydroneopterin aldolase
LLNEIERSFFFSHSLQFNFKGNKITENKHQFRCCTAVFLIVAIFAKNTVLGSIKLRNIKVFAYHGCLEEEGQIGSDYRVDLKVNGDLSLSAKTDALKDTIDYVHLNKIVKEEMAIRSKLLETVAERIINRVLNELLIVQKVRVDVSKINPPIGGNVAMVTVRRSKSR